MIRQVDILQFFFMLLLSAICFHLEFFEARGATFRRDEGPSFGRCLYALELLAIRVSHFGDSSSKLAAYMSRILVELDEL